MKKFVQLSLTAILAFVLVFGVLQAVMGGSILTPLKNCVGWNCQSATLTTQATNATEQIALAIYLPPPVLPNVGWNS